MINTFNKTYTVTRGSTGTKVKGRYTKGAETTFDIKATIMRMTEKEKQNLPEGLRNQDFIKIYTGTDLLVADNKAKIPGDKIEYKNNNYEITGREDWDDFNENGLGHFRLRGQKIDHKASARGPGL